MAKKEPGKVERIAADLRAMIDRGVYPPGGQLPSVSELQAAESIASQTARDVYRLLEKEGVIFTRQGKGSFVSPFLGKITRDGSGRYQKPARSEGGARGAFEAELNRLGLVYRPTPTEIDRARPPKLVAEAFKLHHSAKALYRRRVMHASRDAEGESFAVQIATSWFPGDIAFGTVLEQQDTGPGGSKSRLADLGHAQKLIEEKIEVRMPSAGEAASLGIPADRPVYELTHQASTAQGRVVEIAVHVMPVTTWRFSYSWELSDS
uniref:GntR family transcriptional regulator n=1 Tax=Streptomyces tubercidicus TaxID=47759 RepID=UPI0030E2D8FC|nr:GntR family transcriptional regulator [Streptomyces tubercidicus]